MVEAVNRPDIKEIFEIFDRARDLVRRRVGDPGRVTLEIVRGHELNRLRECAEQEVLRIRSAPLWPETDTPYGCTTLNRTGGLVLVNMDLHPRGDGLQAAATCVHELVHCVQLNQRGHRARKMTWLRNNYGLEEMSDRDVRIATNLITCHEKEAERWERRLAGQLTKEQV